MSLIEVGGGPVHNRVEAQRVKDVNDLWATFIGELQKPGKHGINNNQLKVISSRVLAAMLALDTQVQALPAQGRVVSFSGEATTRLSDMIRKALLRDVE